MALIHCYNCGAKISDKAQECPKCGAHQNRIVEKTNEYSSDSSTALRLPESLYNSLAACAGVLLVMDVLPVMATARAFGAELSGDPNTTSMQNAFQFFESDGFATAFGLVFLIGTIFYFLWMYRCVKISSTLEPENMTMTPSQAVWSNVIPILFFFKPYRAVSNIVSIAGRYANEDEKGIDEIKAQVSGWWALIWTSLGIEIVNAFVEELYGYSYFLAALGYALSALSTYMFLKVLNFTYKAYGNE